MYLIYRDHVGMRMARVDGSIDFCGGLAYFDVGEETLKIPITDILRICTEEEA